MWTLWIFSTKKLKEYENKNVKKSNLEINRENVEYSLSNDDIENVGRILKGKDILPNANELIKEVSGIIFETVVGNVFNIANDCIKKPIFELLQYNW